MAKKNYRKIPQRILNKLQGIAGDEITVGCTLDVTPDQLAAGKYAHLGIPLPPPPANDAYEFLPTEGAGKYSNRNRNGFEVVRRDLPKETHYTAIESPNFGDWSKGSHTVYLPYKKYPRDFYPPRGSTLKVQRVPGTQNIYRVTVSEVVSKTDLVRLLECINLLQESAGHVDVLSPEQAKAAYLGTLQLNWEILPPGQREQFLAKMSAGKPPFTPQQQQTMAERYDFLESLHPQEMLVGASGLERYMGAKLRDDLVVFENAEYGNAMYIMYENWQVLSQRSRVELLTGRFGTNFDRVVHRPGWPQRVRDIISNHPGDEPHPFGGDPDGPAGPVAVPA